MAHKHAGSDPSTHRLSPYSKKLLQNKYRTANIARDAKLPHRHRPKQTDEGW